MLRFRNRLIVILAYKKKINVRISILPGPDVMYILPLSYALVARK